MYYKKFNLTFFAVFLNFILNAQYIKDQSASDFISLSIENGLSQNTVNTIFKDKAGYLWFGTDDGLNRYNSYDIDIIDSKKNNVKSLKGLEILDLYEDIRGIIWIGTDNGLKFYNPISETVNDCSLFGNFGKPIRVTCIEKENDSSIWLGTSEGLLLYNFSRGVIKHYTNNENKTNSLSNTNILSIINNKKEIWIGTQNGLNYFNKTNKTFRRYHHSGNKSSIAGNTITALSRNKKGGIWIGTLQGGISLYSNNTHTFQTFNSGNSGLPHDEIRDISPSSDGNLWIATNGGGICKMDVNKYTFSVFDHNPNNEQSLVTNSIYSIYEDRDGIVWVGTYAGGVCFNISKNNVFKIVKHHAHDPNSISESRIRSIYLDSSNNLWLGTWGGISKYDPKTKKYTSYSHDKNNVNSLSFNTVTSIFEDSNKNMWFGTYTGGLNLLNTNNNFTHFKHSSNDNKSISDNKIYCITEDHLKNLWIGTESGLNLYDPVKKTFRKFGNMSIRDINIAKDNTLILATVGGISIFNPENLTFINIHPNELDSTPLSQIYLEQNNNSIWICSQGSGLGLLDLNSKKIIFYTENDGLPSNFVSSIIPTKDNALWISTYKGLVKFNKTTKAFENLGKSNKLFSKQFQPKASLILPDNNIAFGGSKGLIIFNPDSIVNRKTNPKTVFTALKINNKLVDIASKDSPLKQNISSTKELRLKSNQNDFSIDFATLDFSTQGENEYAYILENYMDNWVNIGTSRSVSFTNLSHGNYILKVKNLNNRFKGNYQSIKIVIDPPFYFTWWFKILTLCIILILFYYYNKYTLISIKQKNDNEIQRLKLKNEEEFSQMRFRFFTYISHELRTPLTLISDPLNQLIKQNKESNIEPNKDMRFLKLINKNVFRLVRLVDQILDISKLEGDTLSLQVSEQNIIKCIENTAKAFYEFAIQNEILFKFHKTNDKLIGWIDDDKIEKIMYNLLSNAFKFTLKKGSIYIFVEYTDESKEYIKISIKDNGIGIAEDKLSKIFEGFYQVRSAKSLNPNGAGIGLDYVSKLTKLHKGTINVESEPNVGSIFSVTIPIDKKYYENENIKVNITERAVLAPIQLEKEPQETQIPFKKHSKNTPCILVVEDDFDIRTYIVESLSHKFKVIQASNGQEGLSKAIQHIPDLILSDTLMPIMDGIEFCKEIKKNDETIHIPFLFLSAWTSDEFKIKGLELGAIDYIKKPFSFPILESRITNIIENSRKISEKSKTKIDFIPENLSIDSTDDLFISKAYEILDQNFDDPDFNAISFQKSMNMSHSGLYRKLKQLTGKSSNEFIRDYRLKRATQIIKQDTGLLISEISIKSGFNDPKYFSKCFKEAYGFSPTEFAKKHN